MIRDIEIKKPSPFFSILVPFLFLSQLTYASINPNTDFSNYSHFEKKLILSETYQNEPTNSDAKTSTGSTSKVNSSSTNFATGIGYSSEKTIATIGQGTH
jgi:hypothetical protein